MSATAAEIDKHDVTGLEDVVRSVRGSARTARVLGEDIAGILERELAMVISISENIRDDVISENALSQARKEHLPARLRNDAHRLVDLAADTGSVMYVSAINFFENLTDESRPPLK